MRKPHKQIKIHSQIHRFLNEEGLSNIMIADFLNISTVTLKKYMMNPKLLRVENKELIVDKKTQTFDEIGGPLTGPGGRNR